MSFPWGPATFEAETLGSTPGAAVFGCDSLAGVGTVEVVLGLDGSTRAVLFEATGNQRHTVTAVSGGIYYVAGTFQADAPPDGAKADLIITKDAGGVEMTAVTFTTSGVLKLTTEGVEVASTHFEYCGNPDSGEDPNLTPEPTPGEEYQFLYRVDESTGNQALWVAGPGHAIKLGGGIDIGPNPVATIEFGICSDTTFAITLDAMINTDVEQDPPVLTEIASAIAGNILPESVEVKINASGYLSTRAILYGVGEFAPMFITTPAPVESSGRATVALSGLAPDTWYEYEVEALDEDEAWVPWGQRAAFKTAPVARVPVAVANIFLTGCEKPGDGSEPPYTWDYAIDAGFDYAWHGGDLHYANVGVMEVGPHRDAISTILRLKPAMREFIASIGWLGYNPSDHDGGGGNSAATQDPSTVYSMQAHDECWPHWEYADLGGEVTRATAGWIGRTKIVCPDFRTLARSNALDPDTDAKVAYSAAQEAWILQHLADRTAALVVLCFDQPWPGTSDDLGAKEDHMAYYPNQRARINAGIAARLALGLGCFIVQADYHGLTARDPGTAIDNDCGGAGLIGVAGSLNKSGNIVDPQNYTSFWPDPLGPDIWVHGELLITDVDDVITVLAQGRDNDNGVYVLEVEDEWTVPQASLELADPSYDLGPLPLTDVAGRFRLVQGTELPNVPAKLAAGLSLPATHGRTYSSVFADGGRLVLRVLVTDLDINGVPGGRLQRDINLDTLKGVCGSKFPLTVGYREEWTGGIIRDAPGWVLASVPLEIKGLNDVIATVTVDLEHAWSSRVVEEWNVDLTDDGIQEAHVTIFDGSTAPITDALYRCSGGVTSFTLYNRPAGELVRDWFKVKVPEGYFTGEANEDMLPEDKAVVVDGWSAWLIDNADGWDTSDGVDVRSWLVSSSNGGTPLILYPLAPNANPDDRQVRVHVKREDAEGAPLFAIRGRESYY